jgi:hypothetical protein
MRWKVRSYRSAWNGPNENNRHNRQVKSTYSEALVDVGAGKVAVCLWESLIEAPFLSVT